jgi:hypothetical protein
MRLSIVYVMHHIFFVAGCVVLAKVRVKFHESVGDNALFSFCVAAIVFKHVNFCVSNFLI